MGINFVISQIHFVADFSLTFFFLHDKNKSRYAALTSHQDVAYFHSNQVVGKQSSVWLYAPRLYTIPLHKKLDEGHLPLVVYNLKLPALSSTFSNPLPSINFPVTFSAKKTIWSSPIQNTNLFFTSFLSCNCVAFM